MRRVGFVVLASLVFGISIADAKVRRQTSVGQGQGRTSKATARSIQVRSR